MSIGNHHGIHGLGGEEMEEEIVLWRIGKKGKERGEVQRNSNLSRGGG